MKRFMSAITWIVIYVIGLIALTVKNLNNPSIVMLIIFSLAMLWKMVGETLDD
jgi:hypothetical protein